MLGLIDYFNKNYNLHKLVGPQTIAGFIETRRGNNLLYADDTILIVENEKDLQALLDIEERKSLNKGLELNGKKTEVIVISQKAIATCNIYVKGTKLRQRETFR